MYLSKAKVSYMLIIESTQDHCPRKHPLLADQLLSAEEALVVFFVSTDKLLLVLQAARQTRSRSHSPPCHCRSRIGFCAPPEFCPRICPRLSPGNPSKEPAQPCKTCLGRDPTRFWPVRNFSFSECWRSRVYAPRNQAAVYALR